MARTLPNAADVASKWKTNFGAAGQAWANGIDSVQIAPGIAAAAAVDRYLAGVNNNATKYVRNVGAVSLGTWKETSKAKGASRLQSGATAGMAKYQAGIQRVLDAEKSIIPGLPPKGDVMANIARSSAFQLAMHQAFNG